MKQPVQNPKKEIVTYSVRIYNVLKGDITPTRQCSDLITCPESPLRLSVCVCLCACVRVRAREGLFRTWRACLSPPCLTLVLQHTSPLSSIAPLLRSSLRTKSLVTSAPGWHISTKVLNGFQRSLVGWGAVAWFSERWRSDRLEGWWEWGELEKGQRNGSEEMGIKEVEEI